MIQGLGMKARTWWQRRQNRWGVFLAAIGFLQRIVLWITYQPIDYGDTSSYFRLAQAVSHLPWKGYDGTRVPGYPIFMALLGLNEERIWIAQMFLGLFLSLLLYWFTWRTTGSVVTGLFVGGLYNLIPGQLLFEANVLTETLTTFCVVVSFALFVALTRARGNAWSLVIAGALGVAASAIGMVRPLFYPLTIWFLPFVWFAIEDHWRQRFLRLIVYSIGPLLIQGGWLLYINNHYHMISPTTMAGYSLVQHTGEYFEYLPDEVAPIRDTYLQYRDAQIAERGVQTNAIWEAIPAMTEASGLNFFRLSRELRKLSLQLIREHPDLYLQNVVEGWVAYWKAPVYWRPEAIQVPILRVVVSGLSWIGRGISILANALFLMSGIGMLFSRSLRLRLGIDRYTYAAAGMVWVISVLQTLVDHGDNPRFLVPLQMMVIYVVFRTGWYGIKNRLSTEEIEI